jgi:hypothetical protein
VHGIYQLNAAWPQENNVTYQETQNELAILAADAGAEITVEVNKYAHEGSAFSRKLSSHATILDAVLARNAARQCGVHRFVIIRVGPHTFE